MKRIRPKNWTEFQHYKQRNPPWIRLYKNLLDNFEFQCLPTASKALAPMLWLMASECDDGEIPANTRKIAFRLRMTVEELSLGFEPLLQHGFFEITGDDDINASTLLAPCLQHALPETETEADNTEAENRSLSDCSASDPSVSPTAVNGVRKKTSPTKPAYPQAFETFWREYPTDRLMSKKNAHAQWARLTPEDRESAVQAIPAFKAYCRENPDYRVVHAERYISQRRFDGFLSGESSELKDKLARIEELNQVH